MFTRALTFIALILSTPTLASDENGERFPLEDPFQVVTHLTCPEHAYQAALSEVLASQVHGEGPVTVVTLYDLNRHGRQRNLPFVVKDFSELLKEFNAHRLSNGTISRAMFNASQYEQRVKMTVCLLAEGCTLQREHAVMYVQFAAVAPPDDPPDPPQVVIDDGASPKGTKGKESLPKKLVTPKKKTASKGSTQKKRAPKMMVRPKGKGPKEPLTPEDFDFDSIQPQDFPRILLVTQTKNDVISEAAFAIGLVRGLVLYSEESSLNNWLTLNRMNSDPEEDPLYVKVKSNLSGFGRFYRAVMVASAENAVRHYFFSEKIAQREDAQSRQNMFLWYQRMKLSLDEFAGEKITPENIFESFEKIAAEYFHP